MRYVNTNTNNLQITTTTTNNYSKTFGCRGDSSCKGGKCDCCRSAILEFLLWCRDGGCSGIVEIVVVVTVMVFSFVVMVA